MSPSTRPTPKEERLLKVELLISRVLRFGVLTCGSVIALGLLARLWGAGSTGGGDAREVVGALLDGGTAAPAIPASLSAVIEAVASGRPDGIMAVGLLLLIALPICRVALTFFLFLFQRDWAFTILTSVVLAVLLSGILLGRAL